VFLSSAGIVEGEGYSQQVPSFGVRAELQSDTISWAVVDFPILHPLLLQLVETPCLSFEDPSFPHQVHMDTTPSQSVQSLSRVRLFATPWTAAHQACLSITNSRSLLKLMSIESVMPSNHLNLCRPLLSPSIFPRLSAFKTLHSFFRCFFYIGHYKVLSRDLWCYTVSILYIAVSRCQSQSPNWSLLPPYHLVIINLLSSSVTVLLFYR